MTDTMTDPMTDTTTDTTYTKTDAKGRTTEYVIAASGRHLRVATRTVGQSFGTVGQLLSGVTVVAETDPPRPLGYTHAARIDAIELATKF
jgi:hypothetical protein